MSFRPIASALWRRFDSRGFVERADTKRVLCPAETRICKPAFAPENEFERVLAFEAQTTATVEASRVFATSADHGQTVSYTFKKAFLEDGSLYAHRAKLSVRPRRQSMLRRGPIAHVDNGLWCSTYATDKYFGHFLTDGLVLESSATELGLAPFVLDRELWQHEPDYRKLVGLSSARHDRAALSNLTILDDRALNSWWIARFKRLRMNAAGTNTKIDGPGKIVFLARGHTGALRSLVNEREIIETLDRQGVTILHPEMSTATDLQRALCNCPLVIAVEGSAIAHAMMLCPETTAILTVMPPRRFNAYFKGIADAVGMRWGFVVANDAPNDTFYLPIDRLELAIGIALSVVRHHGSMS